MLYDVFKGTINHYTPTLDPNLQYFLAWLFATGLVVGLYFFLRLREAGLPQTAVQPRNDGRLTPEQIENQKIRDRNNKLFLESAYQYLANHLITVQGEGTGVVATSARLNLEDPNIASVAIAYASMTNQQEIGRQQTEIQRRGELLTKQNNRLQIILGVFLAIQAAPIIWSGLLYLIANI